MFLVIALLQIVLYSVKRVATMEFMTMSQPKLKARGKKKREILISPFSCDVEDHLLHLSILL